MSNSEKPSVVSMSGGPIHRYGEPKPFEPPMGEMCLEQISNHIETHLGKVETVFHEILSDTVHVDVHLLRPNDEFPFARLVTSGMSDLPMPVPDDVDAPRYTELLMTLPGDWKLDEASFKNEEWYWPIRLIKTLARFPHKFETWLGWGHTMSNGSPAEPYASNTKLCGMVLLPSVTVPSKFHKLRIDETKEITFYAVVPLYEEELNLKLRSGCDALTARLEKFNVSDIIDLNRVNVAKKRLGIF